MTAQPVPTPALDRAPDVSEALTVLRDYGVPQLHRFGGKRSGKALERVLSYVAALEQTVRSERTRRVDFEAQAEGEFLELRLQVRTWQGYAVQLEARRNDLRTVLDSILKGLPDLRIRWWWWPARRRWARGLAWARDRATETWCDFEPTPPTVDLDP
jgi:hypothetical protein